MRLRIEFQMMRDSDISEKLIVTFNSIETKTIWNINRLHSLKYISIGLCYG